MKQINLLKRAFVAHILYLPRYSSLFRRWNSSFKWSSLRNVWQKVYSRISVDGKFETFETPKSLRKVWLESNASLSLKIHTKFMSRKNSQIVSPKIPFQSSPCNQQTYSICVPYIAFMAFWKKNSSNKRQTNKSSFSGRKSCCWFV